MRKSLRSLVASLRSAKRRWHRAWTDWRSGTVECFGGPYDGQRIALRWAWYVDITGQVRASSPLFCEGAYYARGNRMEWEQWCRVNVSYESGDE